jgi:hypothetical protein
MSPRSGVEAKRSTMQDSRRFLWESTTRDAHHFSNRGASKVAADVAAKVRRMAEKNGWTNQAMQ